MDNLTATRNLCTSIVSTFFPDAGSLELMLTNEGVEPLDEYVAKDPVVLRIAIRLCMGYCESSRSENGISVGVYRDDVKKNIARWCDDYGLDADEELSQYEVTISDASNLW